MLKISEANKNNTSNMKIKNFAQKNNSLIFQNKIINHKKLINYDKDIENLKNK